VRRGARGELGVVDPGLRKASDEGVLDGGPSGGAGFGLHTSPVTCLAEGGMMCWSSSSAHGAAGRGWVSGSLVNNTDG
jgi:hypothetical protein